METGKMYALSILRTMKEQNETEALDGNLEAKEFLKELTVAVEWVESK